MKNCELCSEAARVVCESDEASLCFDCDAKVHGANFLVARHQRLLLCRRCQSPTPWRADGPHLLGPTVSLCRRCLLRKCHRQHDEDEGESRRNQEEEEEDGDDDDDDEEEEEEEEEEGEEQVVPWAIENQQEDTMPPLVAAISSSSEEEAAATTERNGLLKRTRENAADRPTSSCSSFSRDRLSDQPRQQVRPCSGCNIDDEASSDSFRPSKSRKTAATPFRSASLRLAAVDLTFSGPRHSPI